MRGVLFVIGLAACSGSSSGDVPARVVVTGRFDTQTKTDCSIAGAQIRFGEFRATDSIPIKDGSRGTQGQNHVTCRVVDRGGDQLAVEGSLEVEGRLIFAIEGTFPKTTDPGGFKVDKVSISNGLTGADFGAVTEADGQCNVVYTTKDQGASTGRVWGEVTCPHATKDPTNGGKAAGSCVTIAQFQFQDCATE